MKGNEKHKVRQADVRIGDWHLSLSVVDNLDELFNELLSGDREDPDVKDERIPYWADLWPSAIILAEHLATIRDNLRGKRVLEIGCGLGLPGLIAAKSGARITMTDYMDEPLVFARKNFERNGEFSGVFEKLDWRMRPSFPPFDISLASDVAYERKSFSALRKMFTELTRPGSEIFITEPNRAFSKDFLAGPELDSFTLVSATSEIVFRDQPYKIHLHRLKRK
ncbi:MAG: methyltransferase [Bacteroidia bacterium]|nr:methyltransferase [Bacteroidia bacterium]